MSMKKNLIKLERVPLREGWAWSFGFRGVRPSSISPTLQHKDK